MFIENSHQGLLEWVMISSFLVKEFKNYLKRAHTLLTTLNENISQTDFFDSFAHYGVHLKCGEVLMFSLRSHTKHKHAFISGYNCRSTGAVTDVDGWTELF